MGLLPMSDPPRGLNMMKAVRDFVRKRVGNTWGDYQVRYQYIQIMQLLDA